MYWKEKSERSFFTLKLYERTQFVRHEKRRPYLKRIQTPFEMEDPQGYGHETDTTRSSNGLNA